MSVLFFGVGAIAAVVGVAMIAFGVPTNEFSLGNMLIVSGVTALIGGLILIGLGFAVIQLRRIAEALALRPHARGGRQPEQFETQMPAASRPAPMGGPARIPYPPKPKSDPYGRDQYPFDPRMAGHAPADAGHDAWGAPPYAPQPRYNDEYAPPMPEIEEVPLLPPQVPAHPRAPVDYAELPRAPNALNGSGRSDHRHEAAAVEPAWRQPPAPSARPQQQQAAYFDAMWPTDQRGGKPATPEEPRAPARAEPTTAPAKRTEPEIPAKPRASGDLRAVAILKSGVVDGMGYTLFVDGSIEATLPQGTLRFASISDLRNHLERNT